VGEMSDLCFILLGKLQNATLFSVALDSKVLYHAVLHGQDLLQSHSLLLESPGDFSQFLGFHDQFILSSLFNSFQLGSVSTF
jgi:hypothetical protein